MCPIALVKPDGHDEIVRISARADYAIRVLLELAAETGAPLTCEAMARAQGIPFRFLKSVVQDLRQAALVVSQRGCEGGYWLARGADRITVADAIAAVDGEVLMVRNERIPELAYSGSARHLGSLWHAIEEQLDGPLQTTIAQLAAGSVASRQRRRARVAAAT